jgi:hypothetical protein
VLEEERNGVGSAQDMSAAEKQSHLHAARQKSPSCITHMQACSTHACICVQALQACMCIHTYMRVYTYTRNTSRIAVSSRQRPRMTSSCGNGGERKKI